MYSNLSAKMLLRRRPIKQLSHNRKRKQLSIFHVLASVILLSFSFSCDSFKSNPTDFLESGSLLTTPGPILFVSDKSTVRHLYSMEEDGSSVKRLIDDPKFEVRAASWSPDNQWLMLTGGKLGHKKGLFLLDESGFIASSCEYIGGNDPYLRREERLIWFPGTSQQLPDSGTFLSQNRIIDWATCRGTNNVNTDAWGTTVISDLSNDESTMIGSSYTRNEHTGSNDGQTFISFWSISGDSLRALNTPGQFHRNPLFSTDGKSIVAGVRDGNQHSLVLIDVANESSVLLDVEDYVDIIPVAWSGNDNKILVQARHRDALRWSVVMVNSDGSGATDLSPFEGASTYPTSWRQLP